MTECADIELLNYATRYNGFSMTGTRFVMYRDIPTIITQQVHGVAALDYGCGTGHSTWILKNLGFQVKGVDINKHMIRIATENDPDGDYTIIKSGEIPSEDNFYDIVFAAFVLLHVSTKTELLKILREVARVLKKGGAFIAIVGSETTYTSDFISLDSNFEENNHLYSGCTVKVRCIDVNLTIETYFWTDEDYRDVILSAGLNIVQVHEPLGKDSDGYEYKDEKKNSPCRIYVAKKLSN